MAENSEFKGLAKEALRNLNGDIRDMRGDVKDIKKELGEDKIKDDRIGEESKDENKSFPSHPRDQFLYILTEFSKDYQYPFQEEADGQIYDYAIKTWRNVVDPIRELEKKIEYWKKNPGALQSKGKSPRVQLHEFLEKEAEYQDGVLEKEKSLDRERNDG